MQPQGDDTRVLHYERAAAQQRRERALLSVHIAAGLGALAVMVATAPSANWNFVLLAIIATLTICSELTSVEVASAQMRISGSFLGIVLAAVLLNGTPAALVGIATIAIGWPRTREPFAALCHNLVTFTWVPLLTGLLFHAAADAGHLTSADAGYYGLALAAFVFALGLNVVMAAGFVAYRDRASLRDQFQRSALFALLVAEMFSAVLTLVAIFVATRVGEGILALFALLLLMFQYLVGQLLISQERGEELQQIATTDELTGLPNRKWFMESLDDAIDTHEALLVLLLDLDHFKEINDTLGHAYGDRVLAKLGPRLLDAVGPGPIVARLGGDEFAVMLPDYRANQETPDRLASRLIEEIREPVRIDDVSLAVDTSIGIARFPEDGSDAQTLMRRADIAMYAAKENRDGFHLYRADHDLQSAKRLTVLGDFRRALMTDEVILYFQPIVDLRTRQVIGAESLVRWMHPDMGLLSPDAFLQIVEQTGMVGPLASLVLEQAIQQCEGWRRDGRELTVAVNLSVRNLLNQRLASEVDRLLARYSLPSNLLQVEITESMFLSDHERVLHTVRELRRSGIKLAVDDYGTGHSTLANLKLLEVDELKIDKSFVMSMLNDPRDKIIVRSTIELGHELGLLIVAEGVEDAQTLATLSDLGCDLAQGYYLARPMPADAFPDWVDSFERSNSTVS